MKRIILIGLASLAALILIFLAWVALSTFHPEPTQEQVVNCEPKTPELQPGQKLKVLSWNVQYMAGKDYVFFYDLLDGSGPDQRPSPQSIGETLEGVARIINEEKPDIILLQEMDDASKRTDYMDQTATLQEKLNDTYPCSARAYYWKADFVPHPRVMGSVGMQLVTLSRYKIDRALRHQLAMIPANPIYQQFNIKRAVLETYLPVQGADRPLIALNTHLDAFAQGSDTMQKQIQQLQQILDDHSKENTAWLIGGDFNLLPPGPQYDSLGDAQQDYYRPETELAPFFEKYRALPSVTQSMGPGREKWYTHFPNDPAVNAPDRTIDYIFASLNMEMLNGRVRHDGTLSLSDHLPVITTLQLPY